MKKVSLLLYPLALLCFISCKEQPILIPDPSLNVTGRTALVEEVTGVRCPNCPVGTQTLVALQQQYGKDRLVVVSIHAAGSFSVPYPSSKYDFRSPEIQELANFVGALEGFPTAAVNRRLPPNEVSAFLTGHTRWTGEVVQDLQQDPSIAVSLKNTFNPDTRSLQMEVELLPDQIIVGDHRLTVLIAQDSIVDPQVNGNTFILDYIHRHVVRDVVSAPSGDPILDPLETGVLIKKTYQVTLPLGFDAKHCSVIAYVHRNFGGDREVIQATEKYVEE